MASSFRSRYEIWLAVHSLLMYEQGPTDGSMELSDDAVDEVGRQECARLAVIAAMVASQEVMSGVASEDEDAIAA